MATERSSFESHVQYPDQKRYDFLYYNYLLPHVHGNVLDIGCGVGIFTDMMAKKDEVKSVYAVDRFPVNERIYEIEKITHVDCDITKGIKFEKKADCIVSTEFIEHITEDDFIVLLEFIKKTLKKDGIFCGSTPDKTVPTTNPYHLREYTLDELKVILEKHFKNVKIENIGLGCQVWIASNAL